MEFVMQYIGNAPMGYENISGTKRAGLSKARRISDRIMNPNGKNGPRKRVRGMADDGSYRVSRRSVRSVDVGVVQAHHRLCKCAAEACIQRRLDMILV